MKTKTDYGEVLHLRIPRDLIQKIDARIARASKTDPDARPESRALFIRRAVREHLTVSGHANARKEGAA
jgi:hypothetical protein